MRNKKLAKLYSDLPCLVCKKNEGVVGHHIISFGSRPDYDEPWNIIPLCFEHHREIHDKGLTYFASKYLLQDELNQRGFFFDNKWRPYVRI